MPTPPPTCSPGSTVAFHRRECPDHAQETATCRASSSRSSISCDRVPGRPSHSSGSPCSAAQTAASLASATCSPGTGSPSGRPTGSGQAAHENPRSRGPAAPSNSRRLPAGCGCGGPAKPWVWLDRPRRQGPRMALPPECQLDRLAVLIPQPRRHRHRYHGVFAPNHPLRWAVTALAVGNVGKQRDATSSHPLPLGEGRGEGAPNHARPRSHDTSRIAWAKLMARVGEQFPLE